ncbi:MAG: YybS family protein [Synergistaceae bacterium]|jgi:uncharacterized protein YybS (DUF2232 family)|nr:YybS family protein [Synergistaceae bacterium]
MSSGSAAKDWFFCTAASFVLFVLGVMAPAMMTMPLMLVYPFPMIFLTFARGVRVGAFSCVTVAVAVFVGFHSTALAVVCFVAWGIPGVLLGFVAGRVKGAEALLLGIACSLAGKLAAMALMWAATGVNMMAPDTAEMERAVTTAWMPMLESLSGGEAAKAKEGLSRIVDYLVTIIPSVVIIFSSAEVLLSYSLASKFFARRGNAELFRLPPFGAWSFPKNIIVALVVGFICEKIGNRYEGMGVLRQVGANLGALTWTLFAVQGLAVLYFFMGRFGFPKIARVVIIVLAPLVPVMGGILSILGIADIGIDLRKRVGRKKP